MPTVEREVQSAVEGPGSVAELRRALLDSIESGDVSREELYAVLDRLRLQYRRTGREDEEELIMDVMDLFHGWAHPSLRI